MNTNIWQGQKIRLRAVESKDWEVFHLWDQDTEAARNSYFIPFPSAPEAAQKWTFEEASRKAVSDHFRFVIEDLEGNLVGTLNTHSCEPRNGTFSYGVAVRSEFQRLGYATEAIELVLRYFFDELRYQKATVSVFSFNEPSLKLHERLGFVIEGRQKRMIYTNGHFFDNLLLGLTVEEFRAKETW